MSEKIINNLFLFGKSQCRLFFPPTFVESRYTFDICLMVSESFVLSLNEFMTLIFVSFVS